MSYTGIEMLPEPSGLLAEPPRRPPTAIGAATPPPPFEPYSGRHFLTRRIALGLLAVLLALTTFSLASSPTVPRLTLATGTAAATTDAALQAVSARLHPWREVVGPAAWRLVQQAAAWPARFGKRRANETLQLSVRAASGGVVGDAAAPLRRGFPGRSGRRS
jgi:hypothetical protein